MNISLAKYKDLPLKVTYYTKKRHLGTKIFLAKSRFQDVLLYFEKNLKDARTFLKSCYFLNGKQIFPNDILLYYCTLDPHLRLVEEDLFIEIEELELIDDSSEPVYQKLLKPVINPFKLIILNVKEGVLQMVDFPKDKIKEFGFDGLINNNYASCNSLDALFISYGKNFWIISNKNFAIEKKEMPIAKEKHSMYYILSNNSIFIAGGNNEDSFYYDIKNKQFIPWGKMNGIQEKPALIQYGEFLYSFNSFNSSGIYFERTKLTSPTKKWEKLIPQSGDQESGFFYNQLYGVSKCSGGNILFAGGINNQLRTFVYNLNLNVLYININKDESVLLNERTFYKIDHNFNIAITQNIEKDHIIGIVNKNAKSLNLLPFEQIGNKTRNKLLQFDNPRNRLPGNLVVQCRYMSVKDYENFLKQKSGLSNNLTSIVSNNGMKKEGIKNQQIRNKTPLALERIMEGSDEENDEDEFSRNKSSSAKKEKSKFELDLNDENMPKFNLFNQKSDKKEKNKENKENNEKNENIKNHSDLEPEELDNQNITNTELKPKNNNKNNINDKMKEKEKEGEASLKNKGLENNKQIPKNDKLINTKKEEKDITKNKNDSKKDINNNKENNNINKDENKNININLNNNFNNIKVENINETNNKNITKIENKEKITKINTNPTNVHKPIPTKKINENNNINKIETVNTQQQNIKITHNTNITSEQNKIVNIQKSNTSNTSIITSINTHQKINSAQINEIKKTSNNSNNPFIDNDKYQNIAEKESIHIKEQSEPNINKVVNSTKTKTMTTVHQKKQNVIKHSLTNTTEERIQTDPNINNSSNKSRTNRQSKGKPNNDEHKIMKKTNSFRAKLNVNQEPKKGPKTQRIQLNINLNSSNPSLTEKNKIENNINKTQINLNQKGNNAEINNNIVVNNNNNIGIKITKTGNNTHNEIYNIKNNENNKEGKRYVLTRNVQRVRKEEDAKKKNINENEGIK